MIVNEKPTEQFEAVWSFFLTKILLYTKFR